VEQQDILAKLPADKLLAVPGPSFLVIEAPRPYDKVGSFNAWWDISAAIWRPGRTWRGILQEPEELRRLIALVGRGFSNLRMTATRVPAIVFHASHLRPIRERAYIAVEIPETIRCEIVSSRAKSLRRSPCSLPGSRSLPRPVRARTSDNATRFPAALVASCLPTRSIWQLDQAIGDGRNSDRQRDRGRKITRNCNSRNRRFSAESP